MSGSATLDRTRHPALPVVLGLLALAARPVGWSALAITVSVGLVGLMVPVEVEDQRGRRTWILAAAVGIGAVAGVRALAGDLATPGPHPALLAAALAAAVAEEAFFRRLLYGWLAPWGAAASVALTALAFAAVHVPAYGPAAFPVDLGAGLVLGWQRWATGGWSAPAVTHAVANLLGSMG